jgi:hypothetical protein
MTEENKKANKKRDLLPYCFLKSEFKETGKFDEISRDEIFKMLFSI